MGKSDRRWRVARVAKGKKEIAWLKQDQREAKAKGYETRVTTETRVFTKGNPPSTLITLFVKLPRQRLQRKRIMYHGKWITRTLYSKPDRLGEFDDYAPLYINVPKVGGGSRKLYNGMKYRTGSAKNSPMKRLDFGDISIGS